MALLRLKVLSVAVEMVWGWGRCVVNLLEEEATDAVLSSMRPAKRELDLNIDLFGLLKGW
jgi:hypothetical protein